MLITADLHIHSHYSRATSKDLDFEHLFLWAQQKGVNVIGTGDFTHPGWFEEIKSKLEPSEDGLLRLKDEYLKKVENEASPLCRNPVRFMLSSEISCIYKKKDRTRKVHHIIFAPDFEKVAKINAALEKIGNLKADGRPILGLDSKALLEIALEISEDIYIVPAHIWTPWFSLLGSKSGFDTLEECFEDLSRYIFSIETGLSSDPPMNWRCSHLDRLTLISNSDAHSPSKLAREANLFNCELSYQDIFDALKTGDQERFLGTVEFYPEEGKYHFDGHRKCNTRLSPEETIANKGICPVCGKKVTVGVMHRVDDLADRPLGGKPEKTHPYHSFVTLPQIIAEVYNQGESSKKVQIEYSKLLSTLGPELKILRDVPIDEIRNQSSDLLAEGVRKVRVGELHIEAGYDGEYGTIKIFSPEDREKYSSQMTFFDACETQEKEEIEHEEDEEGEKKTS